MFKFTDILEPLIGIVPAEMSIMINIFLLAVFLGFICNFIGKILHMFRGGR